VLLALVVGKTPIGDAPILDTNSGHLTVRPNFGAS
jgi:hypothetical protein